MSAKISYKGKDVATGFPAFMIMIAFLYVCFCLLVAIGAAGTFLALTTVRWVFA